MSHKTSPARRAAFFKALRETGNQTLACERAKVSSSWVQLHRSTDPAFKAEVGAAVAEAREALLKARPSGSMKPGRNWGHQDGEELVVRGSRGRRGRWRGRGFGSGRRGWRSASSRCWPTPAICGCRCGRRG
jgi:hypothetical protein